MRPHLSGTCATHASPCRLTTEIDGSRRTCTLLASAAAFASCNPLRQAMKGRMKLIGPLTTCRAVILSRCIARDAPEIRKCKFDLSRDGYQVVEKISLVKQERHRPATRTFYRMADRASSRRVKVSRGVMRTSAALGRVGATKEIQSTRKRTRFLSRAHQRLDCSAA